MQQLLVVQRHLPLLQQLLRHPHLLLLLLLLLPPPPQVSHLHRHHQQVQQQLLLRPLLLLLQVLHRPLVRHLLRLLLLPTVATEARSEQLQAYLLLLLCLHLLLQPQLLQLQEGQQQRRLRSPLGCLGRAWAMEMAGTCLVQAGQTQELVAYHLVLVQQLHHRRLEGLLHHHHLLPFPSSSYLPCQCLL